MHAFTVVVTSSPLSHRIDAPFQAMKKSLLASLTVAAVFAAGSLFATDAAAPAKEVTLVGTGKCTKCSLGIADKCQNALVVKQDGKEITYLLSPNEVSEGFHKKICEEDKEIKVTGTVKETGGKKELTATKIELVKG